MGLVVGGSFAAADPRLAYSGFLALEESMGGVREASRGSFLAFLVRRGLTAIIDLELEYRMILPSCKFMYALCGDSVGEGPIWSQKTHNYHHRSRHPGRRQGTAAPSIPFTS